jgi:hypothetical protein
MLNAWRLVLVVGSPRGLLGKPHGGESGLVESGVVAPPQEAVLPEHEHWLDHGVLAGFAISAT